MACAPLGDCRATSNSTLGNSLFNVWFVLVLATHELPVGSSAYLRRLLEAGLFDLHYSVALLAPRLPRRVRRQGAHQRRVSSTCFASAKLVFIPFLRVFARKGSARAK